MKTAISAIVSPIKMVMSASKGESNVHTLASDRELSGQKMAAARAPRADLGKNSSQGLHGRPIRPQPWRKFATAFYIGNRGQYDTQVRDRRGGPLGRQLASIKTDQRG